MPMMTICNVFSSSTDLLRDARDVMKFSWISWESFLLITKVRYSFTSSMETSSFVRQETFVPCSLILNRSSVSLRKEASSGSFGN